MQGPRSARARAGFALLAAALAAFAPTAVRADPGIGQGTFADPPLPPRGEPENDDLVSTHARRTWNEGSPRYFLATTLDVGWVYVRPRASLGWGKPFNTWFGIDVNPVFAGQGMAFYGGLRLALPRFDIRVGPRYLFAFNREYLKPQDSYDRLDLSSTAGDPARIVTYETEAEFSIPTGPGDFIGLASASYVTNIPDGMYVFEETLRIIVNPPWVWRARAGWVLRFGSYDQHSVGLVVDALDVPRRDDSKTVRFGPIIRILLSRHVEVRGSFVPTIYSQDKLGIIGGDFTELGFRYRWATE